MNETENKNLGPADNATVDISEVWSSLKKHATKELLRTTMC